MFVLLTTLYIVAIGKKICQAQVSEDVKYLPSPFMRGHTTLPVNYHRTSTLSQTFQYSAQTTDKSIIFVNKNNSATTHRPANHNQQNRRRITTRLESGKMDKNQPVVNPVTTYSFRNSTSMKNNPSNAISDEITTNKSTKVDNIYDKVYFEADPPPMDINFVTSGAPTRKELASKATGERQPPAPVNVTQPPGPVNVTRPPGPVNVTRPPGPVNVTQPSGPVNVTRSPGLVNVTRPSDPVNETQPLAPVNVTQPPGPVNVTRQPGPINVTQPPGPVNVTLEDRSSFDGDACPTGYVRVNGVCVMPD